MKGELTGGCVCGAVRYTLKEGFRFLPYACHCSECQARTGSLLKRGIIGAFHHVSDKHLTRYLAEFDRRWNTRGTTDGERTVRVIQAAIGKRLTYFDIIA